jgi:hypothetical protein
MFWVFCAFLGTLILLCVWMLVAHGQAADNPAVPGGYLPGASFPSGAQSSGQLPGPGFPGGYRPGGQVPEGPAIGPGGDGAAASAPGTSGVSGAGGATSSDSGLA